MKLEERIDGTVAVLSVRGRAVCGPDVQPLRTCVKGLVRDGISQVVVDLSSMKWVGAAMMGALVDSLKTTQNAGGDLRLTGITARISTILMVTKLAGSFQVIGSADRAVAGFKTEERVRRQSAKKALMLAKRVKKATKEARQSAKRLRVAI